MIKSYALQSLLGLIQFNCECCCEISPLPPCLWDPSDTGKYSVKNISSRVRYKYHQVMSSSQYPLTLSHLQLIRTNQHGKIVFSKISMHHLAHISCFSWKLSIVDKCHPCVLKFILGWKKKTLAFSLYWTLNHLVFRSRCVKKFSLLEEQWCFI